MEVAPYWVQFSALEQARCLEMDDGDAGMMLGMYSMPEHLISVQMVNLMSYIFHHKF